MFKTRLLSGILLVLIALVTIISGGDILFATVLLISLIGMSELYKVLKVHNTLLGVVGYAACIVYYGMIRMGRADMVTLLTFAFLVAIMAVYVFSYPKYRSEQIMITFFGLVYVAVMLSYVYQTRELTQGAYLVWLIILCSWGCDTCAYCVGMLIGKHKMSPKLSPKKSVEGAVGGVAGAALLTALYCFIFRSPMHLERGEIVILAVIAAIAGLISMVGDLTASAIKRNYDIKDYGKLIPGHGGILDRFDSMIITAPIIYFLALHML